MDRSSASRFNGNSKRFGVSLNCEDLLFQKLDLYLFNLFWLSLYDDGVGGAELRRAPSTGNIVIIGEGISNMCLLSMVI